MLHSSQIPLRSCEYADFGVRGRRPPCSEEIRRPWIEGESGAAGRVEMRFRLLRACSAPMREQFEFSSAPCERELKERPCIGSRARPDAREHRAVFRPGLPCGSSGARGFRGESRHTPQAVMPSCQQRSAFARDLEQHFRIWTRARSPL